MKNTRKIFAMVVAVVMILALAIPTFAAEGYTLTLNGAQAGHTYTAYQIFAGDLNGTTLSNITWGSGVTAAGQTALGNAAEKADSLDTVADAEAFATAVAPYLGTAAGSVTIADGATSGTISGLAAGYYLVQTTAVPGEDAVYTYYIMKVVADTSANIKADVPEVEKTVEDADVSIGDTVTFTLTATMPSTLVGYETYKVVFHDTMSAGLTFNEGSVKVTVAGVDKTNAFTVTESNGTLTISCDDVLDLGATASSKIIVTYDAVLNANAVIGTEGNSNKVYLEYSNNPNGTGTGNTPADEVKVYTWEIPVFKYTGTNTPLAGAGFTLYTDAECTKPVKLTAAENNIYKVNPDGTVTQIITGDTGKFEIEGLAQGTYYLKETTTPAGYNTCPVVTVVIGADGALTQNGEATTQVKVLNNSGTTLPETGGMGTTLFITFGAILAVGAAVLLITKKRVSDMM